MNKCKIINAAYGDPYLISEKISNLKNLLSVDRENSIGGLSYSYENQIKDIESTIRFFFKYNYNFQLPEDTQIIFGTGSTELTGACYWAIQKKLEKKIVIKTNISKKRYYSLHKDITNIIKDCIWDIKSDKPDVIINTSPSNPDGKLLDKSNIIKDIYNICDMVYATPLFTKEKLNAAFFEEFINNDKMIILNSFSKYGLAGARCGFALVRDIEISNNIKEYTALNTLSNPNVDYPFGGAAGIITSINTYKNKILTNNFENKIYNLMSTRRIIFIILMKKYGIKSLNVTNYVPYIYNNKSKELS